MGKLNRAPVFSTPLIICTSGLWGNKQALIGIIVYIVWVFMGLDEAEHRAKKISWEGLAKIWFFYFCSFELLLRISSSSLLSKLLLFLLGRTKENNVINER